MKPIALHESRDFKHAISAAPTDEVFVTACVLPQTARHWLLPKPRPVNLRVVRVHHPALAFNKGVQVDLTV
jgi:hypothetical protein